MAMRLGQLSAVQKQKPLLAETSNGFLTKKINGIYG